MVGQIDAPLSLLYDSSMNKLTPIGTQPCDAYELIQQLMLAGKQVETQLDTALAAVGLSAAKWNVLRHLMAADGQLPLGQLAAKLACVKSNATQLVDRLEAEQFVCRLPDPGDRRSIRAEITHAGRQAFAQGQCVVADFEEQLFADYTEDEQQLLKALLERLRDETGEVAKQKG